MSPSSSTARPSHPEPPLDLLDRRLDLVSTVTPPCTVALVDDPNCQPPTVGHLASPVPQSESRRLAFTAPSPSAQTLSTFTFAVIDHRLRAPHRRTIIQETCCTTQFTPQLVPNSTQDAMLVDNNSSHIEPQGHLSILCLQLLLLCDKSLT